MAAVVKPLALEQGASFHTGFVWHQGDASSPAMDLTGCTARLQIRMRQGTPVLLSATTANGGITLQRGGVAGRVDLDFTAAMTDALVVPAGRVARYDLEVVFPSGDVVRVLEGDVTVDLNITQDIP